MSANEGEVDIPPLCFALLRFNHGWARSVVLLAGRASDAAP
jgi:hypothetical protein